MEIGFITHEEATIKSFIKDPEFADYLMSEVLRDGDEKEIAHFQKLYDEAKARAFSVPALEAVSA